MISNLALLSKDCSLAAHLVQGQSRRTISVNNGLIFIIKMDVTWKTREKVIGNNTLLKLKHELSIFECIRLDLRWKVILLQVCC